MEETSTNARFSDVGNLLDELVSTHVLPGANVLIRQGDEEVYYRQVGLSDVANGKPLARDTIFRLFSMTKPVTTVAIMILVDDGVIDLNDKVGDYVPELASLAVYLGEEDGMTKTEAAGPIAIRELLTHTAGFSYWFYTSQPVGALYAADPLIDHEPWRFDPAFGGHDGLIRSMAKLPLVAQPGERWHYSMSFEVVGIVVERATGMSLDAFMQQRIFEPLGMSDTGFAVDPEKGHRLASLYTPRENGGVTLLESASESPLLGAVPGPAGGGGLVSTIDDYARFADMLRKGGELDGERVLSEASVRAMMTNQLADDVLGELPGLAAWGLGGTGEGLGFGLGGYVVLETPENGPPAYPGEYSWGGAAATTFWVDPTNDLTVVFMTQLQPPVPGLPKDKLHTAVYGDHR